MSRSRGLEKLKEIAREKVQLALFDYVLPEDLSTLTLGCFFEDKDRIFSLYLAKDRPEEAVVLAKIRVNSISGATGPVEVFLPRRSDSDKKAEQRTARHRLIS